MEITIPTPSGGFESFQIFKTDVMSPELAAKFPEIQTFAGVGTSSPSTLRFDLSPAGFHAQVLSPLGDYYVDPYYHLEDQFYAAYYSDR